MSGSVCVTLTKYAKTDFHSPWQKAEQRSTWLYPDDIEDFGNAVDRTASLTRGPGDTESDEYSALCDRPCETVAKELNTLGYDLLPPPEEGWEDADLELTIYW